MEPRAGADIPAGLERELLYGASLEKITWRNVLVDPGNTSSLSQSDAGVQEEMLCTFFCNRLVSWLASLNLSYFIGKTRDFLHVYF